MLSLLRCVIVGWVALQFSHAWEYNSIPKNIVELESKDVISFHANLSESDQFKLLEINENSILIGARNVIYNVSLHNMEEHHKERIEWQRQPKHHELCLIKGKSENDCQNYVRVSARISDKEMLLCGTNAYYPLCRHYTKKGTKYEITKRFSGRGVCPYDPNHNSTAVFSGGELYVGTVADFSGVDPLIYRNPLRTPQYDLMHLNAPNFVGSFAYGDYVYFFFRETALEHSDKAIFSRVGRVSKTDKGGSLQHWSTRWTSFFKSRITCSVPGKFPFYFNEIQSISHIVEGTYGGRKEKLIYGLFTTPENSPYGAAVCAFRFQDIIASFDGPFKDQRDLDSKWLPVNEREVPKPRPGQSINDSHTLPEAVLNFIKSHTLMDKSVSPFYGVPLLTHTSQSYKFTKLAVDPQVRTADGKTYDVIIIGTDNGKVVRAINSESYDSLSKVEPIEIEEFDVSGSRAPITDLRVVRLESDADAQQEPRLLIVTNNEISSVPLFRCHSDTIATCSECVALQDPYCAWNPAVSRCVSAASISSSKNSSRIHQNVRTGHLVQCPNYELVEPRLSTPNSLESKNLNEHSTSLSTSSNNVIVVLSVFALVAVICICYSFFRRSKRTKTYILDNGHGLESRNQNQLDGTRTLCCEPTVFDNFVNSAQKNFQVVNEIAKSLENPEVVMRPDVQEVNIYTSKPEHSCPTKRT